MADALTQPFIDRREAGQLLAQQLRHYSGHADALVLGLPRGGLPVAYEVATVLGVRLDLLLVRRLGVPGQPERAMGAIAPGGIRVLNPDVIEYFAVPPRTVDVVADAEARELDRRQRQYRHARPPLDCRGQTVIVVTDRLATGAPMQAAVLAAQRLAAARVVVAAPVGAADVCRTLAAMADEVICARQPSRFGAVNQWYYDFPEVTDGEVQECLDRARQALASSQP